MTMLEGECWNEEDTTEEEVIKLMITFKWASWKMMNKKKQRRGYQTHPRLWALHQLINGLHKHLIGLGKHPDLRVH